MSYPCPGYASVDLTSGNAGPFCTKIVTGLGADGVKIERPWGGAPSNAHRLVDGVAREDCVTLTRLWLSDDLPRNSESRMLGVVFRALKQHTALKFIVTYADPSQGHVGTIYQATNFIYTGPSEAMPLLDLGDGVPRHSRSIAHAFGTHSVTYLKRHGVPVRLVAQAAKHRYLYFLDRRWRSRLLAPVLPYPKGDDPHETL